MIPEEITSAANPRIKRLVRLRQRRQRDVERLFLVEGAAEVGKAVRAGLVATELYYDTAEFAEPPFPAEVAVATSPEALARASYRDRSPGVLAVFPQFPLGLERLRPASVPAPLAVALEGIEKPGNLGAVMRTADAAGVDGVIAIDLGTDPFNPNVIRSSTGALLTVPLAVATLAETLQWARAGGMTVMAAHPEGGRPPWSVEMTGPCLLLVGSEHDGLSEAARRGADVLISVPMRGSVDSLNASVVAALLVYEARRQRDRNHD